MKCPFCGSLSDRVLETRVQKEGECIRRRRECLDCNERFSTQEILTLQLPAVIKKDGRREPFNRAKIFQGIQAACQKRNVPKSKMDSIVEDICKWALKLDQKEIPASVIGGQVLKHLKDVDDVAYVRFASVHRTFNDLSEFLKDLGQPQEKTVHELPPSDKPVRDKALEN
jgi:transcriptional repressor NrdR